MFQRISGTSGFNLYYNPTVKFKTTSIRIYLKGRLEREVEEEAMLPFLLKRGSSKFPSLKHLSRRLEELFGTSLSLDIAKAGEMQVLVISMDLVNPRYLREGGDLLFQGIEVLNDILLHPVLEDGVFPKATFDQERLNLERYIRSVIDDKIAYAHLRLVQEMFRGEPFGHYEWGALGNLPALTRESVYRSYRKLLAEAPVDVYIVGSLSVEDLGKMEEFLLPFEGRAPLSLPDPVKNLGGKGQELIIEEQPLEQSKLEMGFRVDVSCGNEDYYAMILYSAVLGGGSYSKLFKSVREKAGMAYYAHSSIEKLKGFLYVTAGIDARNLDAVTAQVRECMDEVASGRISDEEFRNAKRSIITGFRSIADSAGQTIEFDFHARAAGRELEIARIIDLLNGLTREQVAGVARFIHPGKTFFLKGTGNNDGADHP